MVCIIYFICQQNDICTFLGGWAIPVSLQGNFWKFILKLVHTGFCKSSKQANSQLKRKLLIWCSTFLVENLFSLRFHNGYLSEGYTEAAMCVKWRLQKFDLKILNNITYVATSASSNGIFKTLSLYIGQTKIFVWHSQMFLVVS